MNVDPDPYGPAFIWLSWIRIRVGNANPIQEQRKMNKETWFLAIKKVLYFVGMFVDLLTTLSLIIM
jgi:hypothetical protein